MQVNRQDIIGKFDAYAIMLFLTERDFLGGSEEEVEDDGEEAGVESVDRGEVRQQPVRHPWGSKGKSKSPM